MDVDCASGVDVDVGTTVEVDCTPATSAVDVDCGPAVDEELANDHFSVEVVDCCTASPVDVVDAGHTSVDVDVGHGVEVVDAHGVLDDECATGRPPSDGTAVDVDDDDESATGEHAPDTYPVIPQQPA